MSLYLGNKKIQVPNITKVSTSKLQKAFFDGGGQLKNLTATTVVDWFDSADTADVTNFSWFFYNCKSLTTIFLFDTAKATRMDYMFRDCNVIDEIPRFNTSKVTNMEWFAGYCTKLWSLPYLDTSKVTNMASVVCGCTNLRTFPAWDLSAVTSLSYAFNSCPALKTFSAFGMKVSFDISPSTSFTESALVEILNNLASVSTTQTLTMGSINLAKLTDDEKAIATDKGWTLK